MRRIYLPIALPLATTRHCSNDCPFIYETVEEKGFVELDDVVEFRCRFFDAPLKWDKKRKYHGNIRLAECKKAERQWAS